MVFSIFFFFQKEYDYLASFRWPVSRFRHCRQRRSTIYSSALSDSIAILMHRQSSSCFHVLLLTPCYFMLAVTYDLLSVTETNDRWHCGSQRNWIFQGGHDVFRRFKHRVAAASLRIVIGIIMNSFSVEFRFVNKKIRIFSFYLLKPLSFTIAVRFYIVYLKK